MTDGGLGDLEAAGDPDGPRVEETAPPQAAAQSSRSGAVSSTAVRKTARTRGGVRERARSRELFRVVTVITFRFSGAARLAPAIDDELVARERRVRIEEETECHRLAAAPVEGRRTGGERRQLPANETRHAEA